MIDRALIAAIRRELRRRADPAKAPQMQAYMKSAMPYLGVQTPGLREACRTAFAAHPLATPERWRETALALWRSAKYREERLAALLLTGERRYAAWQTPDTLPMYEELIVTGAWWDYVDLIASRRLGPLLRRHPARMARTMRAWSRSRDLWKRRASILCQLSFKRDTDLALLYDCIEPNLDDREFFIRKAIGWALRQYAWTDPEEVRRYVTRNRARLSALSVREALKHAGTASSRRPRAGDDHRRDEPGACEPPPGPPVPEPRARTVRGPAANRCARPASDTFFRRGAP
jgi:3-methyladenine DNA glycosylase AlkD